MIGVTSIPFEEQAIDLDGFHTGMFAGEAEIDEDGNVCCIQLDGYRGDKGGALSIDVPVYWKADAELSFAERIARALAVQIEANLKQEILEAHGEWLDDLNIPEYRADAAE